MQRVRGLAAGSRAVVALAIGCGLVLTGCRDNPDIAAYVGAEQLTEVEVDQFIDDTTAKLPEGQTAPTRSDVVITYVLSKLCNQKQDAEKFADHQFSEQDRQAIAPVTGVEYYDMRLDAFGCLYGIPNPAQVAPSDADLQEIYDRAQAKGLVNVPLDQIREQLSADASVRQAIAVKRMLHGLVADADVSVNPRYRPMEFRVSDLGSGEPLVVAVVGEPGSDAVRDIG